MQTLQLRIRNASQVVVVTDKPYLVKEEMNNIVVLDNATVIADKGLIVAVGATAELDAQYPPEKFRFENDIDGAGCCVLPGFVDAHTHPVWDGDRVKEFTMKLAGATYMDVHRAGGGIGYTVKCTRAASEERLTKLLLERMDRMLKCGTTTAEAKSGYGLDLPTELKMLRVLHAANAEHRHPLTLVGNYLGGHAVPEGTDAKTYAKDIVERILPKLIEEKKAGHISPEFIDVFHEAGIFETEETREVLLAGKRAGLDINFHGDELHHVGSGELARELAPRAISHLEKVSDEGIKAMLERPTFAVLLPTTAFIMRLEPPPARKLIEAGVPVVVATDFNPNAHCLSVPYAMTVACVLMHMTVPEALAAATINAAASLNKSDQIGSISVGKHADLLLLGAPAYEHICYEMDDPPIKMVFKDGVCVVDNTK